ncbi:MAG: HAD family hydrolase [Bryobacteraceae bacterium]|nr:HAD family hydrolase [Bryobacteraceae bacterium]
MTGSILVLFDIDGTLLRRAGPAHGQALEDAVRLETGVRVSMENVPVYGMLDRDIITQMMREAGQRPAAIRAAMPGIVARAQRLYQRRCPDLRQRVCPGVRPLLRKLGQRQATVGLVTGNLSAIGWRKVQQAGLGHHFHLGAFADMGSTRGILAGLAAREARRAGWATRQTPTYLIGDTANDIAAAKQNGMVSIAVATGHYSVDELAVHAPDILLEDLRQLKLEQL